SVAAGPRGGRGRPIDGPSPRRRPTDGPGCQRKRLMRIRRHMLPGSALHTDRAGLGGPNHRSPSRRALRAVSLALAAVLGALAIGCVGNAGMDDADAAAARKFPLTSLPTARVTIDGHSFEVWLAQKIGRAHV